MFGRGWRFYYDEGGAGGGNTGGQQGNNGAGNQGLASFDEYIAKQPEDVRKLYETHTAGLKNALSGERDRNKTLEKDLRDAASKAEKGSEAEKKLTTLADQVSEANRKTSFYESAVTAGCTNLRLAYMAATSDDLFKKDGSADFDALKKNYPELFGAVKASNGAGGGTNNNKSTGVSINDRIRAATGRS